MPIVDEKAPRECDFDAMVEELKGVDSNTACVFNCQVLFLLIQVYSIVPLRWAKVEQRPA